MVKIENYIFGCMTIDGKDYKHDILITPDGVIAKRRDDLSETGHHLSRDEMAELLKTEPEVVVIGNGKSGVLEVEPEAKSLCKVENVKLEIYDTSKAIKKFDWYSGKKRLAAIFHLTC